MDKIEPIRIESERAVEIVDLHKIGSVSFLAQTSLIAYNLGANEGALVKEARRMTDLF